MNIERKRPDGKPSRLPVDTIPVPDEPKIKKVGPLAVLWVKLDRNKRNIGLLMLGVGALIKAAYPPAGLIIEGLGGILSSVGVVHDQVKKHVEAKAEGKKDFWEKLFDLIIQIFNTLFKRS